MKKSLFIFAALLAIAAVSCQKETKFEEGNGNGPVNPSGDITVFSASVPQVESKTYIGAPNAGVYTPLWSETDSILVNGVKSTGTVVSNNGANAEFSVAGVTGPYVALYPGSKLKNLTYPYEESDKKCRIIVSGAGSAQSYMNVGDDPNVPTFDPKEGLMVAFSDDKNLSFHHLSVYYKITVDAGSPDTDNIRYIYIRQGNGDLLAGFWKITYTDADHISIEPDGVTSAVTLDCGENGIPHGTPMIIAIPAYNYANGLIITLKDVNGHFESYKMKSTATQFAASAGTIYDFNPTFKPQSGTINSAADWEAFAAEMSTANDFDRYRWVGNGTVKIGADFTITSPSKVSLKGGFPFTLDGQNHKITIDDGNNPLFKGLRGCVKNLVIDGTIERTDRFISSIADTLYAGGIIQDCENQAKLILNSTSYGIAGGLVCIMTGGSIKNCINRDSIVVKVDGTSSIQLNLQIGGIVGQITNEASVWTPSLSGDALLKDCANYGALLCDPTLGSDPTGGFSNIGLGGIAGLLRGTKKEFKFENCDNHGNITYSAEHIIPTGSYLERAISVGGIIGVGGNLNIGNGKYKTPDTDGLDVTLRGCDNDAQIYNCGVTGSSKAATNFKSYTGGIAGSIIGTSAKKATVVSCSNTGKLLTYDLCGDTAATTAPGYSCVAGGAIGYGGYVKIDSCTVNCKIGNGKRQSASMAGAIGFAMRPFDISNSTIWFDGLMTRISVYNLNCATAVVVPMQYASTDCNPLPSITGSSVTNCSAGASFHYCDMTETVVTDNSASCTKSITLTADTSGSSINLVRGRGYNTAATIRNDVSFSNNTTLSSAPTN